MALALVLAAACAGDSGILPDGGSAAPDGAADARPGPADGGVVTSPRLVVICSAGGITELDLEPPFSVLRSTAGIGVAPTVVRSRGAHHYVVDPGANQVHVVSAGDLALERSITLPSGASPRDVAVVDSRTAFVSDHDGAALLRIDPSTGAVTGSVDLSSLADPDGLPEPAMMAIVGDRLFVQLQRLDRDAGMAPVEPAYLAVVDLADGQLLAPIPLAHTHPDFEMIAEGARLFVSVAGTQFDGNGGVQEIDTDGLTALGFLFAEADAPGALGGFGLASPDKGYILTHTDITESSHLNSFDRGTGSVLGEHHVIFDLVDVLAVDRAAGRLFFPDPVGIHVFDTASDERLTSEPIALGCRPIDLTVVRP